MFVCNAAIRNIKFSMLVKLLEGDQALLNTAPYNNTKSTSMFNMHKELLVHSNCYPVTAYDVQFHIVTSISSKDIFMWLSVYPEQIFPIARILAK